MTFDLEIQEKEHKRKAAIIKNVLQRYRHKELISKKRDLRIFAGSNSQFRESGRRTIENIIRTLRDGEDILALLIS